MRDIFYFTDIHGCRPLFDAIMNYCKEQDPEATIVFGGDAADRGKDGYKIINELLDNPYVIYLKGNHEDMFVKAAKQIKDEFNFKNPEPENVRKRLQCTLVSDYKYENIRLHITNGGISTLVDWVMDGMPMDIIDLLDDLPYTFSGYKYDFCHSAGVYPIFKQANDAEYEQKPVDEYAALNLLWGRSALPYGWAPGRTAIFGHTPVPYLYDYLDDKSLKNREIQPYKYIGTINPVYNGAKIDMDTGTAFTGRAFVLNVYTGKAQGFEIAGNEIKKIECIQM